jgi:aspartyl/asparaginyl-tRNA synthetase
VVGVLGTSAGKPPFRLRWHRCPNLEAGRGRALARLARLPSETVLRVSGVAVPVASAPGGIEVHKPVFEIMSVPVGPLPFDLFRPAIKAQVPTVLDHPAVALRHPRLRAEHRLAATSAAGYRHGLQARGFVEIFTPKLVASATEGGANVFPVDYFGRPAFPGSEPAVLQANHGRRVRARVRDWAGVSRGAP